MDRIRERTSSKSLQFSGASSTPRIIALAGNPNVGKSTIFNHLTGGKQHTGNWPGKTVRLAQGSYVHQEIEYHLVDLPGTYSLQTNSPEEEVARDFICFAQPQVTVIVLDATILERNLNLVLQILEMTKQVVICVNLLDEAQKKKIQINLAQLSTLLGVPVVGLSARSGKGFDSLQAQIRQVAEHPLAMDIQPGSTNTDLLSYPQEITEAISQIQTVISSHLPVHISSHWVALKLLLQEESLLRALETNANLKLLEKTEVASTTTQIQKKLAQQGWRKEDIVEQVVQSGVRKSREIAQQVLHLEQPDFTLRDRKIDRIVTSKRTGIPIMLLLVYGIFWFTLMGANYPSTLLANGLFSLIAPLHSLFHWFQAPIWLSSMVVDGIYKTLAWVISVMLPPMAIFFPLFAFLEDLGYLPRLAFNLDNLFRKAGTSGKQALTMCMGFGCNAVGIMGCRIIDSPRERLIALLTNSFVPCNGRFPTIISLCTIFFAGAYGAKSTFLSTLLLTGLILLGVSFTLLISRLLSKTLLKGRPADYSLELPPYRRPQIRSIFVRSFLDKTLLVLGRAVVVAAPAGLCIWLLSSLQIQGVSLLNYCANFLDPFAYYFGLDGYILLAFILAFPANEIFLPILIMSYLSTNTLTDYQSLAELQTLFIQHGWNGLTALCVLLFTLFHWPCGTSCLTLCKETQSLKWTLLSMALPTVLGLLLCFVVTQVIRGLGIV